MLKEKLVNTDEDMLLLQAKIISFYANNSKLKLYKNRFQLMIKITNDYLNIKDVEVSNVLDICTDLGLIDYKFNDFGRYYYPRVVLAIEDYESELLDILHKYNNKFNDKVYKEIKYLVDRTCYFDTPGY